MAHDERKRQDRMIADELVRIANGLVTIARPLEQKRDMNRKKVAHRLLMIARRLIPLTNWIAERK